MSSESDGLGRALVPPGQFHKGCPQMKCPSSPALGRRGQVLTPQPSLVSNLYIKCHRSESSSHTPRPCRRFRTARAKPTQGGTDDTVFPPGTATVLHRCRDRCGCGEAGPPRLIAHPPRTEPPKTTAPSGAPVALGKSPRHARKGRDEPGERWCDRQRPVPP